MLTVRGGAYVDLGGDPLGLRGELPAHLKRDTRTPSRAHRAHHASIPSDPCQQGARASGVVHMR